MRKPGSVITKDTNADEPLGFDWTAWLAELGVGTIIMTSTWTITGPDSALTSHNPSIVAPANLKTQAYLSGGTLNATYTVVNRITTNNSPAVTEDESFTVLIVNN